MAYIRQGVAEGFCIGFKPDLGKLKQHSGYMLSVNENPEVISVYIEKERGLL